MSVKILHRKSVVAGKVPAPADLTVGEIALNSADGKAFTKTSAGAVVTLNPDFKIWANNTLYQRSQMVEWIGQASTDANGRVTLYPTQNGQSGGTAIFGQILQIEAMPWLTNGASATAIQVSNFNVESGSPAKIVLRGTTGRNMLLLGDSVVFAPSGIQVVVKVIGLP